MFFLPVWTGSTALRPSPQALPASRLYSLPKLLPHRTAEPNPSASDRRRGGERKKPSVNRPTVLYHRLTGVPRCRKGPNRVGMCSSLIVAALGGGLQRQHSGSGSPEDTQRPLPLGFSK